MTQRVDEPLEEYAEWTMRPMKRFNSHEKSLSMEKRVRTLAFEERTAANPRIKRAQERDSPAIDVSDLKERMGKLTKFYSYFRAYFR